MARRTVIGRHDVRRTFARCLQSVVTTLAGTRHLCMINSYHWRPRTGVMTCSTIVRCRNVCRAFSARLHTVMTTLASAIDLCMVNGGCRRPHVGSMTRLTNVRGINMKWRFSGCRRAIVALDTVRCNYAVIDSCPQPGRCRMTGIALKRCRDMCWPHSRCNNVVMTL